MAGQGKGVTACQGSDCAQVKLSEQGLVNKVDAVENKVKMTEKDVEHLGERFQDAIDGFSKSSDQVFELFRVSSENFTKVSSAVNETLARITTRLESGSKTFDEHKQRMDHHDSRLHELEVPPSILHKKGSKKAVYISYGGTAVGGAAVLKVLELLLKGLGGG